MKPIEDDFSLCLPAKPARKKLYWFGLWAWLWLALLSCPAATAYQIDSVLRTAGGGAPLVSSVQTFGIPNVPAGQQVTFSFGFATDEDLLSGSFWDAATVTLREVLSGLTEQFVTIDRTGVYWAPSNPGGLTLSPDLITRTAIAFPTLSSTPSNQWAFTVSAPVPVEFQGKTVELYLDLFDNQNAQQSLAWISQVPEPNGWWLALTGGACWCTLRRLKPWNS
ncbi:MAG: hypothetical protein WCO56_11955 [Verrucomicrobiota bacterium]